MKQTKTTGYPVLDQALRGELKPDISIQEKLNTNVASLLSNEFNSYNSVIEGDRSVIEMNGKSYEGFHISYNSRDVNIYGDVTTALVLGQTQKSYILNGDHRKQYKEIIQQGFEACLAYYEKHSKDAKNEFSDTL